eukprot:4273278-Pyramimonas_sp.AAC.1
MSGARCVAGGDATGDPGVVLQQILQQVVICNMSGEGGEGLSGGGALQPILQQSHGGGALQSTLRHAMW